MFRTINGGRMPNQHGGCTVGLSVYSNEDVIIEAGSQKLVPLGVCIDEDRVQKIVDKTAFSRTGISSGNKDFFVKSHHLQLRLEDTLAKRGLFVPYGTGVVSLEYRGEMEMLVCNSIKDTDVRLIRDKRVPSVQTIRKGDCIGQIILLEHKTYMLAEQS